MKVFPENGGGCPTEANESENLTWKAARGGFWVFSLRIIQELVRLGKILIIARVLSPQDFGLLGIAMLCLATLDTFTTTGFEEALIQKKRDVAPYLDGAWTFLIIRGAVLFLLLFLTAPYAARFFESSDAVPVIRALSFVLLVQGFNNIGAIYFRKNLMFNRYFALQFVGSLTDFTVAVVAVFVLENVWALVLGLLASSVAICVASYAMHPYRPRLSFDVRTVSELWSFGGWVLGSTVLIFLITQGDDILVGRMLGAAALGLYQLAYRISNLPTTEITHVISMVTFPAYSKIQDERRRLGGAFVRVVRLVSFLSFLASVLVFLFARDFTLIFLGEKWMPIVRAIQILVVAGLTRSLLAATGPLFYAVGRPRLDTVLQTLRLLVLAAAIYPLIRAWGINGASLAVAVSNAISCVVICVVAVRLTSCDRWQFLKGILLPVVNSLAAWLVFAVMQRYFGATVAGFFLKAAACIAAYLLAALVAVKLFRYEIREDIVAVVASRRGSAVW